MKAVIRKRNRSKKCRVFAAAVLMAAALLAGCAKKGGEAITEETAAGTAAETAAARETVIQTSTAQETVIQTSAVQETVPQTAAAQERADKAAPELLQFSLSEYERSYPGAAGDEIMGLSATELLTLETPGYEKLSASLESINRSLKSDTDASFREITEILQASELIDWQAAMLPYTAHRFLILRRGDSALVSLTLSADFWTGGAHPGYWMVTFNIDPENGNRIPLRDFVKDYDGFYALVKEKLENSEDAESYFEDWKDTLKETFYGTYEPSYFVTEDALAVYFDVYLLGPYAMGPVYVEFPLDEYRGLFKPQYFPENMPSDGEALSRRVKSENDSLVTVEDLINEAGEYTDDVENTVQYRYQLPKICLTDGTAVYVDQVNREIEQLKKDYVDSSLETMKGGSSIFVSAVSYRSVCCRGITSVLIEIDADFDEVYYYCYNFKEDGSKAENKDVFEVFGMTEEEFEKQAKAAAAESLGYGPGEEPDSSEMGQCDRKSLEEVTAGSRVYIEKTDRSLCFVSGIYTIAGGGYYSTVTKIPGTEHRPDGLTELVLNPQTRDNIRREGNAWYIRDAAKAQEYRLDGESIVAHTVPCFEYGDTVETWMNRYLSEETASGFAMGDMIHILADDKNHIAQLEAIYYWD